LIKSKITIVTGIAFISVISSILYKQTTPNLFLKHTSWKCDVTSSNFTSEAFSNYLYATETMIYQFNSSKDFIVFSYLKTLEKNKPLNSPPDTQDALYAGSYDFDGNNINLHIEEVILRKRHMDNNINQGKELYKGVTLPFKVEIFEDNLYFIDPVDYGNSHICSPSNKNTH
jgi:hypothetical protein